MIQPATIVPNLSLPADSNTDTNTDKDLKLTCSGQLCLELGDFLAQLLGFWAQSLNLVHHDSAKRLNIF